jgi:hypothetical protein
MLLITVNLVAVVLEAARGSKLAGQPLLWIEGGPRAGESGVG